MTNALCAGPGHSWVELDAATMLDNLRALRAALPAGADLMLVVKADAYGHGASEIARRAAAANVRRFAVAHAQEARGVRAAAPEADILVLGAVTPEEVPLLAAERVAVAVVDYPHGRALAEAARHAGSRLLAHLKVDSGMGRLGFHWENAVDEAAPLFQERGLDIVGVFTHFARVENGEDDPDARRQMARFVPVADALDARAGRRLFRHAANSRAWMFHPEWGFDAVRPGLAFYGYDTETAGGRFRTRPILQWKTRVIQVRRVPAGFSVGYDGTYVTPAPTTMAVLGAGYADGYPRALSGRGTVLIGGRRCSVLGRVSMNWIAADAGPDASVRVGEEAVLIGRQGGAEIWADDLASGADTIPYEILVGIHPALPRRWTE
jgi:alanine racemase